MEYRSRPRTLTQTLPHERSSYLDAKINAAIGLCPEPVHPLDRNPEPKPKREANHDHKLGVFTRKDAIRKCPDASH